jgi:hypothetical protein
VDALAVKTKDEPEIVSLITLGEDVGPHPTPPQLHPQHRRQLRASSKGVRELTNWLPSLSRCLPIFCFMVNKSQIAGVATTPGRSRHKLGRKFPALTAG